MASPAYNTSSGSSNFTNSVVGNRPGASASGHLLLAQFWFYDNATVVVNTPPSGWNLLIGPTRAARSGGHLLNAWTYWKLDGGAEAATFTWAMSATNAWGCNIKRYTGVDAVVPVDTVNFSDNARSVDTLDATGLSITSATAETTLVLGEYGYNYDVSSGPAGMTSRVDTSEHNAWDLAVASAGATGDKVATLAGSDSTWITHMVLVQSVAAAAGGQPTSKRHGGVPFVALPGRGNVWAPLMRQNMMIGPSSPIKQAA